MDNRVSSRILSSFAHWLVRFSCNFVNATNRLNSTMCIRFLRIWKKEFASLVPTREHPYCAFCVFCTGNPQFAQVLQEHVEQAHRILNLAHDLENKAKHDHTVRFCNGDYKRVEGVRVEFECRLVRKISYMLMHCAGSRWNRVTKVIVIHAQANPTNDRPCLRASPS